jgi:proteic killer suppression protein
MHIAFRIALRYSAHVIREFRHKGLKKFFDTRSKAGIQPKHADKLRVLLGLLDVAAKPSDMDLPGWQLHALKGGLAEQWSVWVNGNWRLTFAFEGEDATLVDYQDYH